VRIAIEKTMINENTLMESFEDFISKNYLEELANVVNFGHPSLLIDFCELDKFDPTLSDMLVENPTIILELFRKAVKNIQIAEDSEFNIRFFNMPKDRFVRIRDVRSKHIGKLIAIDGLIRQASDVRPVATLAVFECPACGTQMEIAQTEQTMKEPSICSCGRKGRFKLLSKKLVDTQRIVVDRKSVV
jgi:replicative DNA helicase Mcm